MMNHELQDVMTGRDWCVYAENRATGETFIRTRDLTETEATALAAEDGEGWDAAPTDLIEGF